MRTFSLSSVAKAAATAGVVAVERKLKTRNAKVKTLEFIENAASSFAPNWPTNAVSAGKNMQTSSCFTSCTKHLPSVCTKRMYVRACVCMYACTYVCVYVRTYVRMYVCMYVCMHAWMFLCLCVHLQVVWPASLPAVLPAWFFVLLSSWAHAPHVCMKIVCSCCGVCMPHNQNMPPKLIQIQG